MRILYVCTANICRSPSAVALLRDAGVAGVEIRSAGTATVPGSHGCSVAPALTGRYESHSSQQVTGDLVEWADLILTADRTHRHPVAQLQASARERTFTIRQAGRLAQWLADTGMVRAARERAVDPDAWADRFEESDPRRFVSVLGGDATTWLLSELDAARAVVPAPEVEQPARRWWKRAQSPPVQHGDDVPDPHELGTSWHDTAYVQIREATEGLVALLRQLTQAEPEAGGR